MTYSISDLYRDEDGAYAVDFHGLTITAPCPLELLSTIADLLGAL